MTLPFISFELPNTDSVLPSITPHQIALCFLIRGYLSPGEHDPGGTLSQRQALGDALLSAIRKSESVRDPSMYELSMHLSREVTNNLADTPSADHGQYASIVIQSLKMHMREDNILDRIMQLFNQLARMVTTSTNSRAEDSVGADDNSVMGCFLRRCWCDFTALSFEETCTLAAACEMYRHVGKNTPFRPTMEMDRFLAKHILKIERSNLPADLRDLEIPIDDLLLYTNGGIYQALRAKLALARAQCDSRTAITTIHKLFDAPHNPQLLSIGVVASGDTPVILREKIRFEVAALSLASTHARLGHINTALSAINEALRTAQVARDRYTLAQILAVMCQIMESAAPGSISLLVEPSPGESKAEAHVSELLVMLQKLLARAEEVKLPHLVGYARLSIARHALMYPLKNTVVVEKFVEQNRGKSSPAQHLCHAEVEISAASRYLSHLHLATVAEAAIPVSPPNNSHLACLRILKSLSDMFIPTPPTIGPVLMGAQGPTAEEVRVLAYTASLLKSAACSIYSGTRRAAIAHALAFIKAAGTTTEESCIALAQLAVSISESQGFESAEKVLDLISARYPNSNSKALVAARLTIAHKRACYRGDIHYALEMAEMMMSISGYDVNNTRNNTNSNAILIGYRLQGEEMAAEAYFYGGYLKQAEHAAREVLWPLAIKHHQPIQCLRALLLLGRIYAEAHAWSTALRYITSLISHCQDIHADVLLCEAVVVLTRIYRVMGGKENTSRALREIETAMPRILTCGGLDLKARAKLELAQLYLVQNIETTTSKRHRHKGHGFDTAHAPLSRTITVLLREAQFEFRLLEAFRDVQYVLFLFSAHPSLLQCMVDDKESMNSAVEDVNEKLDQIEKERADGLGPVQDYYDYVWRPRSRNHDAEMNNNNARSERSDARSGSWIKYYKTVLKEYFVYVGTRDAYFTLYHEND